MNDKPDVILVRGAPGAGKSSAAKCLARHYPTGVRLEVDALRSMVISVDWTDQDQHIQILSLATRVVRDFLALGHRPVIVVDTFSGDKLTRFLEELQSLDDSLNIRPFALVTALDVLRSRIENRGADQFRDVEVCQKLNADVLRFLHPLEQVIDNTALTPEQTADVIRQQAGELP